jgi:hypothetical protein
VFSPKHFGEEGFGNLFAAPVSLGGLAIKLAWHSGCVTDYLITGGSRLGIVLRLLGTVMEEAGAADASLFSAAYRLC